MELELYGGATEPTPPPLRPVREVADLPASALRLPAHSHQPEALNLPAPSPKPSQTVSTPAPPGSELQMPAKGRPEPLVLDSPLELPTHERQGTPDRQPASATAAIQMAAVTDLQEHPGTAPPSPGPARASLPQVCGGTVYDTRLGTESVLPVGRCQPYDGSVEPLHFCGQ